jgi:hypothetical protein
VFLEFKDKKPLNAIKETPKPNLLLKKVYKINNEGNKILKDLKTSTRRRKHP